MRLKQSAPKFYMSCRIMKIMKSWLPAKMEIKPGHFLEASTADYALGMGWGTTSG